MKLVSLYVVIFFKAEAREKERQKEEERKMKKLEQSLRNTFKSVNVDIASTWDDIRSQIQKTPAFTAITIEAERIRIFKVNNFKFY